jgi:hypothetical protein
MRKLVKVPTAYYTVSVEDYGPGAAAATIVTLHQPLSTVSFLYNLGVQNWENNFGQYLPPHLVASVDWEDAIYVTFESTVGPNPVDIMIYIIENYTQNGYDADNFAEVAAKVAVTPMNFVYQSLDNAFAVLQGLAYQSRCAIYLVEDVFHLKFLPEAGDAVDSINESDTVLDSLVVGTTATEDLITVYEATFKPDYSPTFDRAGSGDLPVQHREVRLPQGQLRLLRLQLLRCRREGGDLLDDSEVDDLEDPEVPAPAQQDQPGGLRYGAAGFRTSVSRRRSR